MPILKAPSHEKELERFIAETAAAVGLRAMSPGLNLTGAYELQTAIAARPAAVSYAFQMVPLGRSASISRRRRKAA